MKNPQLKTLAAATVVLAMAVGSPWLFAQEAEAPSAEALADTAAAPAEDVAAEEEAAPEAAAAAPVKPRDAEILPLASKGLLLDIANSGKLLFAVGDRGVVLVSKNAKDWAQVKTPTRSALTGISFASESVGYAVGYDAVILKTSDGGKSWALQSFLPELEKPLLSVLAINADNAIAVGSYGLMMRTNDGGSTWTEMEAPEVRGDELHLNKITRLANGDLLVVGEQGTMGLSSDAGNTWVKIASPYDGSLFGAQPRGATGAVIFGLRGNVFKTDDVKAAAWTPVDVGTVSSFFGGASLPDDGVALVGLAGKVLKVDGSGSVTPMTITRAQTDANGATTDKEVTGSFSAALAWAGQLVVVGELGVQSAKIN